MLYLVIALLVFIISTIIVGRNHEKFGIDIEETESIVMVAFVVFIGSITWILVLFFGAVFFGFKGLLKLSTMRKKAVK